LRVRRLEITNFRNIKGAVLSPGSGLNLVLGANGQGKTNLVEAITFLSWLRSFRTAHTADILSHDEVSAHLHGTLDGRGVSHDLHVGISRGFRKVTLDDQPVRSSRECLDMFTVVFFSPDDPAILEGGPSGRRALVDRLVMLLQPGFSPVFSKYRGLVRERNEILKSAKKRWDLDVLDACEEAISRTGIQVFAARKEALDGLMKSLPSTLETITGQDLEVSVEYVPKWLPAKRDGVPGTSVLKERLVERRDADAALGHTTVGPHTDDVSVKILGHKTRGHASRGQKKALMLAWKMAEAETLSIERERIPALVLDDALSDLDSGIRKLVGEYVFAYEGQSFLTGTDAPVSDFDGCTVFRASGGEFKHEK